MPPNKERVVQNARKVLTIEKNSIAELEKRFDNAAFVKNFTDAVDVISRCKGKVIVTGMGKSGIIAQKIVATFNSTGTYSIFMHSADSIHGDLGIVREEDVVILISKSGATGEVKQLIPIFKNLGIKIISIVGSLKSELAKVSDIVIDASVKKEACPHNLAPTSSTTAALVIGDALAVSLLQKRGFSKEDFATYHPGGNLGKKLLLKVEDIMAKGNDIPKVSKKAGLKDVIYMISSKRLGCTCVMDKNKLSGIITDGDIRRFLEKSLDINNLTAEKLMNKNPKLISKDALAVRALEEMEANKITQLIVTDKKKSLKGILHMHRLVELGL